MPILVILALLLVSSAAIAISDALKPKVSRSWMIALVGAAISWLGVLLLRLYLPTDLSLFAWQPESFFNTRLFLEINYDNWPYALSLVTLCMAVIFTDSTRSFLPSSPKAWANSLALTAVNLLALFAGDPNMLIFAWVLVDALEFISTLPSRQSNHSAARLPTVFGVRMLSTLTLAAGTVSGWLVQPGFALSAIPSQAGIFFLLAAGLRLGVLPLNLPFLQSPEEKNGPALLLRLSPVASSLAVITRLPANLLANQPVWLALFKVLTTVAALYAAGMWLTGKNQHNARPFWIIALASFSIMCALNGAAPASRAWGTALLLSGSTLFLFDPPIRRIRFLPILGILGFIGLPYTLAASGWEGLLGTRFTFGSALMLLAHTMLVLGYLRYTFEITGTVTGLERHARITYPLGLILIVQTIVILTLGGWPGSLTSGLWVASLASLLMAGLIASFYFWQGAQISALIQKQNFRFYRLGSVLIQGFQNILSLQWLYQSLGWFFRQAATVGLTVSRIIEGEGGILWSLVFLVILITLFLAGVPTP